MKQRHDFFHSMGGRLSDHGINSAFAEPCTQAEAAEIFHQARACVAASPEDQAKWASFLMLFFGRWDAEKGWTKQLHLMARRSNNTRLFEKLGPDTGFDSIGDWPQMDALAKYLDTLD
ncbi:MAG: glucuronate isomerase, partial [Paludibaculum sp.]